jgi:hypothetical protein
MTWLKGDLWSHGEEARGLTLINAAVGVMSSALLLSMAFSTIVMVHACRSSSMLLSSTLHFSLSCT